MEDPDLESLKQEVDFNTPLRDQLSIESSAYEDASGSDFEEDDNFKLRASSRAKKVVIEDKYENTGDNFAYKSEKGELDTEITFANTNFGEEQGDINVGGTSNLNIKKDNKKYRLLCVDEPQFLCGAVMGQGTTFCANTNCSTKKE